MMLPRAGFVPSVRFGALIRRRRAAGRLGAQPSHSRLHPCIAFRASARFGALTMDGTIIRRQDVRRRRRCLQPGILFHARGIDRLRGLIRAKLLDLSLPLSLKHR
jgi:hypothetical protein